MGNHTTEEQTENETKRAVGIILEKIRTSEAPVELIRLYEEMQPKNFAFWLHGYFWGSSRKLKLHSLNAFRFLEEIWQTI